jgi:exopolysaccharide biosynthesis operon protein EpsL
VQPIAGPVADTITTNSAGGSLDERYGRQTIHLDFKGSNNRYSQLTALDYDGFNAAAQWGWQAGHNLSGDLSWSRAQSLSSFVDFRSTERNISTSDSRSFSAAYRLHPDWSAVMRKTQGKYLNSSRVNATSDAINDTIELGLQYSNPPGNGAGLTWRRTDGRYPNRQLVPGVIHLVDNSYRQDDLEANFTWVPTGATRLAGTAGITERRHVDVPERNFRGVTGNFSWNWQPTGATTLNVTAARQVGAQEFILANYVVTRRFAVGPRWSPTAKVSVEARLERNLNAYGGDPHFIIANLTELRDAVTSSNLSLQYVPERFLQLSLSVRHERRTSTTASSDYQANVTTVTAQLNF